MPTSEKYSTMTARPFSPSAPEKHFARSPAFAALFCAGLFALSSASVHAEPVRVGANPRTTVTASHGAGGEESLNSANAVQEASQLMKQGKLEAALEKTDQVLAAKPKDAQARFLKGVILTEMNRHDDAIAMFTRLTEDYPELPEPYNNLAALYAQHHQFDKARYALEMAVRANPAYATAYENLGDIYARMAGEAYGKAQQLDAANASARAKLGTIRTLMGAAAGPATPAIKAEAAPAPALDDKQGVEKAIHDWVAARSKKDSKAFFSAYADDFQPPAGKTRSTWESEQSRFMEKSKPVDISVENLQVALEGNRAAVKFQQHYVSGKQKTTLAKELAMVKINGRWLIQQERIVK